VVDKGAMPAPKAGQAPVPTDVPNKMPDSKVANISDVNAYIVDPPKDGSVSRGIFSASYSVTVEMHNLTDSDVTANLMLKVTHYRSDNVIGGNTTTAQVDGGSWDLAAGEVRQVQVEIDAAYFNLGIFEFTDAFASADVYVNNVFLSSTNYQVK
jgi:hypothetical protein